MTIWKFEIDTTDHQFLIMPRGAKILSVQVQNGLPMIWAIVNPENYREERNIEIYGTGNPFPETGKRNYIGTYQLRGGSLVFHVFEKVI